MNSIQQIVIKAIGEICSTILKVGMSDVGKLTKALQPVTAGMTLDVLSLCAEQMDEALVVAAKSQRRLDGIQIKERDVKRTVMTNLGALHYKRTYFKLPDKTYAYLTDYLIGIESYERFTKQFIAELLELSTVKSYQHAINVMGGVFSRQTVHDRLVSLGDLTVPVTKAEKTPEELDIFADEDHAHLTPKGQAMVPLATVTEGIDKSNPNRHKTVNPLHIGGYGMSMDAFRENVLAVLAERYDLGKVKQVNVHGDAAAWIRGLQQMIPHARLVLDGYHLEKELKAVLALEGAWRYTRVVRDCMSREDGYGALERYCMRILERQTTEQGREKVRNFVAYCASHWDSIVLRMSGETCGSCTEPQVSHVLSDRLSRDPIAWSEQGLNRMSMLLVFTKNGGKVRAEDVRIRVNERELSRYAEKGFSMYRDYASKQAEEVLKEKYDWGIFEHEYAGDGKVDWTNLVRKSLGSSQSLSQLLS